MLKSFKDYVSLDEGLVNIAKPGSYGNVLFLAGGSASGKDTALRNYIRADNFRVIDVDRIKELFVQNNDNTGKHPEFSDFNWKDSNQVGNLHRYLKPTVDRKIVKDLKNIGLASKEEALPNICFNITLDKITKLNQYSDELVTAGYDPKNINLVWVMLDVEVAMVRNSKRDRVVPDDIVLSTHIGAFNTVLSILRGATVVENLDGYVIVIPADIRPTYYQNAEGQNVLVAKKYKDEVRMFPVVKDVDYIILKYPQKPIMSSGSAVQELQSVLEPVRAALSRQIAARQVGASLEKY